MNSFNLSLKLYPVRSVKTPAKAWSAAGFDFYCPDNLTVADLFKANPYEYFENEYATKDTIFDCTYPVYSVKQPNGETVTVYINTETSSFELGGKYAEEDPETLEVAEIILNPFQRILIPSGIKTCLPDDIFLKAENKSGIAAKRGLIVGACVIDSDYRGEIHINLINASSGTSKIKAGEKIVQFVPLFSPKMDTIEQLTWEEFNQNTTNRNDGGFSSSGLV